ncbi:hypothetical protein B1812_11830 [Methylocystis bryophila]|uniref:Uncharacterized protein n=1 Tax=Methylocystis bryophila TaxID=655015 RepID=A0A1W6MVX9_9HYPH|nr:hypothetical protein B1812_11830 [Methylocystis bryophila]
MNEAIPAQRAAGIAQSLFAFLPPIVSGPLVFRRIGGFRRSSGALAAPSTFIQRPLIQRAFRLPFPSARSRRDPGAL